MEVLEGVLRERIRASRSGAWLEMSAENSRRILGKTRRVVMEERSGKALIHQPLFLGIVTAGYREASDCLQLAVRIQNRCVCLCLCEERPILSQWNEMEDNS